MARLLRRSALALLAFTGAPAGCLDVQFAPEVFPISVTEPKKVAACQLGPKVLIEPCVILILDPIQVNAGTNVTMTATFRFEDPNADVATGRVSWTSPTGQRTEIECWGNDTRPGMTADDNAVCMAEPGRPTDRGLGGIEQSEMTFTFPFESGVAGEHHVQVWLVDEGGRESNHLENTLTVVAPGRT